MNNATVEWSILDGSGSISDPMELVTEVHDLGIGMNRFTITARVGECALATDTVTIIVDEFFIPEGFSPNNDGVNDRFVITGLEAFPGTGLEVFDRWGRRVFGTDDYQNDWDGRSGHGTALPNDTYFIVVNLGGGSTYNGYVIIKR